MQSVHPNVVSATRPASGGPFQALSAALDRESTLGYVLVAPVIIILVGLVAYPLAYAIQLSMMDKTIGADGKFVGLQTIMSRNLINDFKGGWLYTAQSFGINGSDGFYTSPIINYPYGNYADNYELPNSRKQPIFSVSGNT